MKTLALQAPVAAREPLGERLALIVSTLRDTLEALDSTEPQARDVVEEARHRRAAYLRGLFARR